MKPFGIVNQTGLYLVLTVVLTGPSRGHAGEIHDLLERGHVDKAKALLSTSHNLINAINRQNQTPLHIAVDRGQLGMVRYLLDQGADVNARDYLQMTPLYLARDFETVQLLVRHHADVRTEDSWGRTPLRALTVHGQPDPRIAKLLLDAGSDDDIYYAISLGDVGRVRALLRKDASLAFPPKWTPPPINSAARSGNVEMVRLLLQYKVDPKLADLHGCPPLNYAIDHPEVVKVLLDAGADATYSLKKQGNWSGAVPEDGFTLLHDAAGAGNVQTARMLLEHGANVNARTLDSGYTALHQAAWHGDEAMVVLFLKHKADPAPTTRLGWTPMMLAAKQLVGPRVADDKGDIRFMHVIQALRARGATIDLFSAIALDDTQRIGALLSRDPGLADRKDPCGKPALHWAVRRNRPMVAAMLLDAGANINLAAKTTGEVYPDQGFEYISPRKLSRTALHEAAVYGMDETAQLLLQRGADVNASDIGATALHLSVRFASIKVAKLLLDAGSNVNVRDREGRTPLTLAEESTTSPWAKEMIALLRAHGATR